MSHGWVHKATSPNYKFCTVSSPSSMFFKVIFWRLKLIKWSPDIKYWSPLKKKFTRGVILLTTLITQVWYLIFCVFRVKLFKVHDCQTQDFCCNFSCQYIFLLAMVTKMVAVWRAESDNKNVKIIQLMRNTTTLPVYHIFGTFL